MESDSIFENVAFSRTGDLADQTHWAELPGSGAWGEATPAPGTPPAPPSSGGGVSVSRWGAGGGTGLASSSTQRWRGKPCPVWEEAQNPSHS